MRLRSSFTVLSLFLEVTIPGVVFAQEGAWSFSGSAGTMYVFLGDVKEDMHRDVAGYNSAGHQLPEFPSISPSLAFSAKTSYRFDRDFSLSLSILHGSRRVESSYASQEHALALKRKTGSTAVMIGIAQHFPLGSEADVFAELQLGMLFARATSGINWTRTYKLSDTSLTYITQLQDDTRGVFTKSKLVIATAVGGSVHLAGPFMLRGEAMYRFAKIGTIDGETTKFGLTQPQTTSIKFDFSAVAVSVGIGVELNR